MKSTSRLRVLSDRIPWILVFVYFCRGLSRNKYERKDHMSGLHRDINEPRNYLTSRRLQKPRERSGGETEPGPGRPPRRPGRRPTSGFQSGLSSEITLHWPKGSRITVQSMSVWSDGPYSLGGTIKPDPLAPGGEEPLNPNSLFIKGEEASNQA